MTKFIASLTSIGGSSIWTQNLPHSSNKIQGLPIGEVFHSVTIWLRAIILLRATNHVVPSKTLLNVVHAISANNFRTVPVYFQYHANHGHALIMWIVKPRASFTYCYAAAVAITLAKLHDLWGSALGNICTRPKFVICCLLLADIGKLCMDISQLVCFLQAWFIFIQTHEEVIWTRGCFKERHDWFSDFRQLNSLNLTKPLVSSHFLNLIFPFPSISPPPFFFSFSAAPLRRTIDIHLCKQLSSSLLYDLYK